MAEKERLGYSRRVTTLSLDEALRERLIVAVKYTGPDGDNCTVRGIAACHDKDYIKVFDSCLSKWIIIPIKKVLRIGTCKQTGKIEENLSHINRPRSNGPRCRSTRNQFSYKRWWKDDNVEEDADHGYP